MLATYQTILEPGDMVILFDTQNTHSLVLRTEPQKGNRPDLLERSYRESLDTYQETYRSLYPDFEQMVSNPAYQPGSQNFWRADGVYTSLEGIPENASTLYAYSPQWRYTLIFISRFVDGALPPGTEEVIEAMAAGFVP